MEDQITSLLLKALSEEFFAFYQYFITKDILVGNQRAEIAESFNEFADDELHDHAQKLIDRLVQKGSTLQEVQDARNLWSLTQNVQQPLTDTSVLAALNLNINAEEVAIKTYTSLVNLAISEQDFTTEKISKEILADEQEHLQALLDFREDITNLFKASEQAKQTWLSSYKKRQDK